MKLLLQFLAIVGLFFATWFGLSRIDYVRIFNLNGLSKRAEKKVGDFIMRTLEQKNDKINDDSARAVLNKIKMRICNGSNLIDGDEIKVHLIKSDDVNAFALPGNNLIVYTGLIERCDSVEELCGVMGHEIGHIALNHVVKRLGSEIGISVLTSMASGGNSETAGQVIKTLSSSAFERGQETEADDFAVRSLRRAHINPEGFAVFMKKIATLQEKMPDAMEWISSHPDTRKRVAAIRAQLKDTDKEHYRPVITEDEWKTLRTAAANANKDY